MERAQKYIMMVYKTKSFSKAAKELFISQPSLSSTVKKLETELGFLIFDRSANPIDVTPQGRIYLAYLEEMMQRHKSMLNKINNLKYDEQASLNVGGTNYLSNIVLPVAGGEFHKKFPKVEVNIDLGSLPFDKLEQEKLEVIFSHWSDKTKYDSELLFEDRIIIAVRKDAAGAEKLKSYSVSRDEIISGKAGSEREITDYNIFKDIEFLKEHLINGSLWLYMSELHEICKFSSCRVENSLRLDAYYDMMLCGGGAVVTSEFLVNQRLERSDEVLYFPTNVRRRAMAIYKKDKRLSVYAREFIDIAKEVVNSNLIR